MSAATVTEVPTWPKKCGCGRSFDEHEWKILTFIGRMVDEVEGLELRNCACGSTIAQTIHEGEAHVVR